VAKYKTFIAKMLKDASLVHGRGKIWMVFEKQLWVVYDVVDLERWM
jgi:hypothetical protein